MKLKDTELILETINRLVEGTPEGRAADVAISRGLLCQEIRMLKQRQDRMIDHNKSSHELIKAGLQARGI